MVVAADWAFIAGLLNGPASVFIRRRGLGRRARHELVLKIYLTRDEGPEVTRWLKSVGRKPIQFGDAASPQYGVTFIGPEASKVLAKCFDRLHSRRRRAQAQHAFAFNRTYQVGPDGKALPGIRLTDEAFQARELAYWSLKSLNAKRRK